MGKKFTVQILSDKEFDSLPYKGISDSLGIADPEKGFAFVRSTGVKEWDLATLSHEIDHLVEEHGTHEDEYGIRHKKGGFLRNILPTVLGAVGTLIGGPVLGGLLGGVSNIGMDQYAKSRHPEQLGQPGQIGSILGAGALGAISGAGAGTAIKGGIAGGAKAAPGFFSKAGGIVKGGLFGTPAAVGGAPISVINPSAAAATPGFTPATSGLLGSAGSFGGVANPYLKSGSLTVPSGKLPGTESIPAMSLATGGVGNAAGNTITPSTNLLGGGNVAGNAPSPSATPFSFASLKTPENIIGGASLLSAAGMGTPQFKMPDSVEQLRSKLYSGQGLSALGQQAQSELANILKSKPTDLSPTGNDEYYNAMLRRTRESYAEAEEQLDNAYNAAGMYGSGEHMAEKAKLKEQLARTESGLFAQVEQQRFEFGSNQKYQAIQTSLGVDKNTMDDIVGLTGLDAKMAAQIYGARVADINDIRKALGTFGMEMILRGQGMKGGQGQGINITLNR